MNFFLCKKIITVRRPTTLRVFLMERSRCPTKRGNQDVPASLKVQTFPFCWIKISHIGKFRILGKKVSLIAFRQVLTKILPAACIQLHNYYLFEKSQLKLSSFIQNSVQQDYLPESYARYLPSYQKCHKIVAPTRYYGLVPPSPEPLWVTLGMGKNPTR